jgi:hypothetical protein
MDLPLIEMELSGYRRHAARFSLPGWRMNGGRYTIAEGFSELFAMEMLEGEGGLVLDPFAGSGTTLLAAARSGWMGVGIEMMPLGRFIVSAYQALEELGEHAFHVLEDMAPALEGIDDEALAIILAMEQASKAGSRQGRKAGAFADMCMMDVMRRQSRLPPQRRLSPADIMSEVCDGLGMAALGAYNGMGGCAMVEADCRVVLRRLPQEKFDAILTSPPFFGRWDGGAGYELEHDVVALAVETGCHEAAPARPGLRWRDEGIGETIANELGLDEVPDELMYHCRMLGWLMATASGTLKEGGEAHIVLENPVLQGSRRALDEAVCAGAREAGLDAFRIVRMPSYKEVFQEADVPAIAMASLRL